MAEQILNSTQEFYLELIESFEAALLTHGIGQRVAHNLAIKATEQIEFDVLFTFLKIALKTAC